MGFHGLSINRINNTIIQEIIGNYSQILIPFRNSMIFRQLSKVYTPGLGLVLGILAASSASIFIRFAQQDAPSLVIAASRLALATLILAPFALSQRRKELKTLGKRRLALMLLSGVFLGLHFATWITSLRYTSVPSSVVLVTTSPLWVALLAPLFLKEKITRLVAVGLAIALAGSVIVGGGDACQLTASGLNCETLSQALQGKSLLGNGLAIAGAWFAAFYLMIGRKVRSGLSLLTYTFIVYGTAAVTLLLMVAFSRQSLVGYTSRTYFYFLALAVIPQLLGHSSFNWALKFIPAAMVSLVLLGEPIASSILAYLILHEPPTILEVIGGVMILAGIYLASRPEPRRTLIEPAS
jgi:drug/metabolite transporter (DMT)-like permease